MGYYLGLDIGTSSVGWAVTDERYHLLRRKGKDLWGVRLFDEAKTAAERRSFRTGRRRLDREQARIAYLKEIFAPAIHEKDPGFLQRLDDSRFFEEDKQVKQPFALFADTGYTDREYYQQFPTIFHLRKTLIESDEPQDVRLVYLAILNMFKHRGHFLSPNLGDGDIGDLSALMDELQTAVFELLEISFSLPENISDLENILADRSLSASRRCEAMAALLNINRRVDKSLYEICKLICGLKGTLSTIFLNDSFTEEDRKYSISFGSASYEDEENHVADMLTSESFDLLLLLKRIYDWSALAAIMKNDGKTWPYLSFARVASWEKHKSDLALLKSIYRNYLPDQYDAMFRVMQNHNYSAYVGSVNSREASAAGEKQTKIRRGAKSDDFFSNLKKQIQKIDGYDSIDDCQYVLAEIEQGTFLPKQLTTDNGVIPYQVHRKELKKILENAESYLPFLLEKDPQSGLTASERIVALFSFRLPYYVGPLKGTENSNSWAVRKEDGTVYPWNLTEKIDVKQTSEKYIENLIRHCTYLSDEKVLPAASLLYEKFTVLNELNNLKIHGEDIPVDLKQNIYRDLFRKTGKRVTNNKLVNYLKVQGVLGSGETEDALSGYDKEKGGFTNTLANYHKFMEVFGVPVLTDRQEEMAEHIIFYSTVYGDSKPFLKEKLTELYGYELTGQQLKRILGYRFTDWGKLSREFLTLEGVDKTTGEEKTLISSMWDENHNLMQVLDQNRYSYSEILEQRKIRMETSLRDISYEDLTDPYISAPVRRMVWQTIRVVQEIEKVMGMEPDRIFVEMTRSSEGNKKRTVSRKSQLQSLYRGCAADEKYLAEKLDGCEERDLRIKKLYLYYLQKGRCMYSGERIPFEKLFIDGYYDIDHIYPRHYVKDDSLENNLVLVKAELNRDKTDEYPVSADIRHRCYGMWKGLRDGGFISEEKFSRLTRTQSFTETELTGFINRQLVETGQGTKAVAEILTQVLSDGKANDRVIYVKAGNVSAFRTNDPKHPLLKCRAVNDFHHANDAYLNIVVGNIWFVKFTQNARNFFREKGTPGAGTGNRSYHLGRIYDFRVERGDTLAWEPKTDMDTVRRMMAKKTPIITRRSFEVHGAIADQQIMNAAAIKKADGVGYIPIKVSDPRLLDTTKYGGYNKAAGAFFFLVAHKKKKKTIRTIESMPIYLVKQYQGKEGLERYCKEILCLQEPDVRWEKIRAYSLLKINKFPVYLTGRSNDRLRTCTAAQLCLKSKYTDYIRDVTSVVENKTDEDELQYILKSQGSQRQKRSKIITAEMNQELYDELLDKYLTGIYSRRPNPVGKTLLNGREKFAVLPLNRQCYVLQQILLLSTQLNQGVDLKDIEGSKKAGVSTINKDITDLHECRLVLQSTTGLYEQEIDLLTI